MYKCIVCGKNVDSNIKGRYCSEKCRYTKVYKNEHIGERFGKLIIVSDYQQNGQRYAECQCDCGRTKTVLYKSLHSGYTSSCGCARFKDLTGMVNKYGVVAIKCIGRTEKERTIWLCKCPRCGKEFEVEQNKFKRNKSCGCLVSESSRKNMEDGWKNITSLGLEIIHRCYLFFQMKNQKEIHLVQEVLLGIKIHKSGWRILGLREN